MKGLSLHFILSSCDSVFSLHANSEVVQNWIINHILKFDNNPTANESVIIVLSRKFWISVGKEKVMMRSVFFSAPIGFWNSQRWECLKMSSGHGAQISRRSNGEWVWDRHFSETGLVVEKMRGFWEEKRGNRKWEREREEV